MKNHHSSLVLFLIATLIFLGSCRAPTEVSQTTVPQENADPSTSPCGTTLKKEPTSLRDLPPPSRAQKELPARRLEFITTCGRFVIRLHDNDAARNFVHLVMKDFYNGRLFLGSSHGTGIRSGDPNDLIGVLPEHPGYVIKFREPSPKSYRFGDVAYVRLGDNTYGGQFLIATPDFYGYLSRQGSPISIVAGGPLIGRIPRGYWNILSFAGHFQLTKTESS